jgi:NADH:ubiquinone oxidoreductase subunit 2 (subunit N)
MLQHGASGGHLTYVLVPLAGDEVLYLYVGGYLFLMFFFASLLTNLFAGARANSGAFFILALSVQTRLRWLLVYTLLSLAGLPPFFFFACKLGLLSLLLCEGVFLGAIGAACLIMLS